MKDAIEALGADRTDLLSICAGLDDAAWAAPSGCPGWSVKDVVAHMGALFWAVVDPATLPDTSGQATEAAQEVLVGSRRSLTAEQVLDDYATVSEKALTAIAGLAGADFEVPLGDLG
ncbi:MAG TPA: maleylpyruvate isomerase N-terminal domain-containing protein, partial [Streptosporangiaceae bacterium]|nr:maleylpyruvate isomerase N-terminal domain-containing protein [Streptosporangiaceae bacterium]